MDLLKSMMIAASGLKAQTGRMRVIAENLANADSVARTPGGDPYQRRIPAMRSDFDRELGAQVVRAAAPVADRSEFGVRYMPGHPAADQQGYVRTPNVNALIETTDMREAQRSYQANINVITAARRMMLRTIEILRA
jgi:flagellar basal-body rod protein FlgC